MLRWNLVATCAACGLNVGSPECFGYLCSAAESHPAVMDQGSGAEGSHRAPLNLRRNGHEVRSGQMARIGLDWAQDLSVEWRAM